MQQQGGSRYGVPPPEMGAPFSSGSQAAQQQQPPQPPPRAVRIPPGIEYLQHHHQQQQQQQAAPEAASPISSRPPPPPGSIYEEYAAGSAGGVFPDEEALGAGEEAERAAGSGNRWPRQETLALLKIRSDMDAAFRDATLKGPLWDDVSRKLAELGYARSAKKCKEKFENVHKYYKRTKEGRAGRQDGKSYRFFSQLEAIQSYTAGGGGAGGGQVIASLSPLPQNAASFPAVISSALVSSGISPPQVNVSSSSLASPGSTMKTAPGLRIHPPGFSSLGAIPAEVPAPAPSTAAGISFSSNTSSSSASDTDGDETEEGVAGAGLMQDDGRKRKREGWQGGGSRKMMGFFDGLMKQVMERQELMQQRFFETIEKREQDRMIREEAWKRQEMARLNREYELMAQERAVAASRDAAVISFLEKFTGFPVSQPPAADPTIIAATPSQPSPVAGPPPPSSPQHQQQQKLPAPVEILHHLPATEFDDNNNSERNLLSASSEPPSTAVAMSEAAEAVGGGGGCLDAISPSLSSSRWPKPEVLALIKLRSGLETRYLEAGPKGPLWEEISLGMKVLGYSRNAKRCKEKWENINKYFKKVKESNKKRPEDAKTCPYFHELDALYRKKQLNSGGGAAIAAGIATEPQQEQIREPLRTLEPISAPTEQENSNGQNKPTPGNHETGGDQLHRNNGAAGIPQVFFGGAPSRGGAAALKKPEDIIRQLMEQQNQPRPAMAGYSKLGGPADSDNPEYDDEDEDYDDEDEEDGKLRYEIQFQRQSAGSGPAGNAAGKVAAAASPAAGSFLAMVQ